MSERGNEFELWPGRFLREPDNDGYSIRGWPPQSFGGRIMKLGPQPTPKDSRIFKGTPTQFFEKAANDYEQAKKQGFGKKKGKKKCQPSGSGAPTGKE